jgi:3-oxocholest-4-en-26-oate---CoA ligase
MSVNAPEWSIPAVLDVVSDTVPDRAMLVWGSVRRTFADAGSRTRRLGAFFAHHGLGLHRERSELERWECGQSTVAIVLSNCPQYIEAMFGAFRARAVPYNVNHHYQARELASLLAQVGADAVVYHRRLAPLLADVDLHGRLLVHVEDGSDTPLPAGSTEFEDAIERGAALDPDALAETSPDDAYLVCTGGTTGLPKGVLWRQADIYVSAMAGSERMTAKRIAASATGGAGVWFAAPPLMHAAAQWTAFSALLHGATVVLHDDARPFDARTILTTAERERVTLMSIVGDAYARPLVEELRRGDYDLSALASLGTGGAFTSDALKHELLELLPHITVIDGYGSSETGGMAFGASRRGNEVKRHTPSAGAAVLSLDRGRFLRPGEDEVGWIARTGRVPLGYLGDPDATTTTFPVIEGRRVSVPGDRATYDEDGNLRLLGRDAMVVNTGGEKVFVEEVEAVLLRHPDIVDALVVGRPDERFGEAVVAIVQLRPGAELAPPELRAFAAQNVAHFKAPRAVVVCDRIGRHPTGKADYRWARETARDAVSAME